jgi:hypothetical protein
MATPHGPMPVPYPHPAHQSGIPTNPPATYYPPVGHPAAYHQRAPAVVYHATTHQGYHPPSLPGSPRLPHLYQGHSQGTTLGVTRVNSNLNGHPQVNPPANSPTSHSTHHYAPAYSTGAASVAVPSHSETFSSDAYRNQGKSQGPTTGSASGNPYNGHPQRNHTTQSSSPYHPQAPSKDTLSSHASHSQMTYVPHASLPASHYLGNSTDQRQLPPVDHPKERLAPETHASGQQRWVKEDHVTDLDSVGKGGW